MLRQGPVDSRTMNGLLCPPGDFSDLLSHLAMVLMNNDHCALCSFCQMGDKLQKSIPETVFSLQAACCSHQLYNISSSSEEWLMKAVEVGRVP